MLNLPHSLIIETGGADPGFLCFYSPDLGGFTGTGTSVADCLAQAGPAMREHREVIAEFGGEVPPVNPRPVVLICDEPGPSAIPEIDWDNDEVRPHLARSVRDDPEPESEPADAPPALAAA